MGLHPRSVSRPTADKPLGLRARNEDVAGLEGLLRLKHTTISHTHTHTHTHTITPSQTRVIFKFIPNSSILHPS